MDKTRTTPTLRRALRRALALLLATIAIWLAWITGDPGAALEALGDFAGEAGSALSSLNPDAGPVPSKQLLSYWDRVVLDQSPLLGVPAPAPAASKAISPSPIPSAKPANSAAPSAKVSPVPATAAPTETASPSPNPSSPQEPEPHPSDEGENEEPPLTTTAPDDIISRTFVSMVGPQYFTKGLVSVYNHTKAALDMDALMAAAPKFSDNLPGPQILIYHSHATEAYTMDGTDIYEEAGSYRTLDTNCNVVRVGEEMKAVFEAAGFQVIHDTTLYDYPSYNDAYYRSLDGVSNWLKQYPSLVLILDVHRDAITSADGRIYKTDAGTMPNCAQVMMVMGSDGSGQAHPNWKSNLSLALAIQDKLTANWGTLARPIVLRTSRFNQHLSIGSILVEVGTHGNTLQEAIAAGKRYTEAAIAVLKGS